jgi:hypothetical protein
VLVEFGHPRSSPRYSFAVAIELTDVQSLAQIRGQTKELSLCGCGVHAENSFPQGTPVRIKLSHENTNVAALARVVYASPELGMGLAFTHVDPQDERILEEWIAELMSLTMQQH